MEVVIKHQRSKNIAGILLISACFFQLTGYVFADSPEACAEWCEAQVKCSFCSNSSGCGTGYRSINGTAFEENDTSYYGCEKVGSINAIWSKLAVARPEHRALVVAIGGASGSVRDEGMEWFCENYFGGNRKKAEVLCISSYARTVTRSHTLSDNIAHLANEIRRLSGVEPKITLIGKSMGGCKLHHAAAGLKGGADGALKDMNIDLFVGVDPSCGYSRHFEKGLDDGLEFKRNVRKLLIFYQKKEGEEQTGHVGYYVGEGFDDSIHIDVNNDLFDLEEERKSAIDQRDSLCNNVGHGEIDDCNALKLTIRELILKRAGLAVLGRSDYSAVLAAWSMHSPISVLFPLVPLMGWHMSPP